MTAGTDVDDFAGENLPSDHGRDLIDDILWSDCPEELYLQRMLREQHQDEEDSYTDSIMGQSTVAGIFTGHNKERLSTGSVEDSDGRSWINFAPIAGSVATEGTMSVESSPSFVESADGTTVPGPRFRDAVQTQLSKAVAMDPDSYPVEMNLRVIDFDEESLASTMPEIRIPDIVDLERDPYDEQATQFGGTRAGLSTLSGDTGLRYGQPGVSFSAQWWMKAEDITYAEPKFSGTTNTSSRQESSNSGNGRDRPKTKRKQAKSSRSTESPRDGCFSRAIRRLTDDDKVFRRTVAISVLFIVLFVSLSAVALVRAAGGIRTTSTNSSSLQQQQVSGPTASPTLWLPPVSGQESQELPSSAAQPNPDPIFAAPSPSPSASLQQMVTQPAEGEEGTVVPTSSPTDSRVVDVPFRFVSDLINQRSPASTRSLGDRQSPQYRALQWSADDLSVSPSLSEERVLQRWTLAVIFFGLDGEAWDGRDGWLTNANECSWFSTYSSGSICDERGRLVRLGLEENNLVGSIPAELGLLSDSLTEVNVYRNRISGSIPTDVGVLTSLRHLSFRRNELVGSIPGELTDLKVLRLLDLTDNEMTGTLPSSIAKLTDLDFLALSGNRFSGTVPRDIALISTLGLLELSSNDFTGNMPPEMCEKRNDGLVVLTVDCVKVECSCCDSC